MLQGHSETSHSATQQGGPANLVLVVEDDRLVALDLAAILNEGGFRLLRPVGTLPAALRLLAQQRSDAAVLDVNLRNDLVTPVAEALRQARVPFVVASAYSRAALLNDEVLSDAPKLDKPIVASELIEVVSSLISGANGRVLQQHEA